MFHPEYDTVAVAELFVKGDMAGARAKLHHDMQHYINEVTGERLQEILGHITALARRATQAGADAIEVHGDRLVGSLCSPLINQRTDEYGGSFENRTRFARAVVRAIREGSPDICIDYKLSIITENPQLGRGGLFIDEAVELAKLLEADGVDTFHVGQANHTGNLNDTIPAMGTRPECFMAPYARRIKEAVSVPVSTVGRIMTPEDGARLIEEGVCDFIGLGRPILCDPDYANKVAADQVDLIRPCIMCNHGCTDAIASRRFISCVLNAENGYEYKRVITPAETPRKIAVVGGGPAGMEAARVAALRGHDVTLYEQADRLGGQLGIAAEESSTVKPFIMEDFAAHNVVVKTNTKVDRITADAVEATETLNPPAPTGRPGAPAPVPAADAPEPETQAISIPCDCVVIASGTAPVTFDTAALEEHGIKVTLVGDCNGKAADINRAVEEGYLAATAA